MRALLSLREYAKRRGVSPPTVSRAVKTKRLLKSVVYDRHGDPKIADVALADQEWEANTDLSRAPAFVKERGLLVQTSAPTPDGGDTPPPGEAAAAPPEAGKQDLNLSEASAREKHFKALIAEQQWRQRAGELVEARLVAEATAHVFTICRTKILAVPSKAKSMIPELTHAGIATLDDLLRQALEELAVEKIVAAPSADPGAAA